MQVSEIYRMIEIEKIHTLTIKNPRNLTANQIIEILSVLQSAYVISRDLDKIVLYINNYID